MPERPSAPGSPSPATRPEKGQVTHDPGCDGYRTEHRVEIVRTDHGTFKALCVECGSLHPGSFASRRRAERLSAGHAHEVECDGRCNEWEPA